MPTGSTLSPATTTPGPRSALAAGAMVLALLATGCAAEDDGATDTPGDEDTVQVEAPEDETDVEDDAEAESQETDTEETETEETEADGASDVSVETVGESPHAFVTGQAPEGPAVDVSGELIIGPGGYMALAQDGQPQVLVFDEDAEFSFRDGAPSVTTPEHGTIEVGEEVEFSGVEHPLDDIDGIPSQRLGGADQQVLFVTGD
ncbi:hypothetical protein [Nesterenkonia sp. PF2B19]|uniref:hypothetical protein n=1 Tax=Nesterenkonia sp. PF2B19 TaxID=1881858 RepID=UPI0008728509|nr:hypothetical protein [Nesterenkonia sp. PF2B19]OSM43301.1 hypothetical protein BCY76_009000 [Nesterenkonia sp. PF2B19]